MATDHCPAVDFDSEVRAIAQCTTPPVSNARLREAADRLCELTRAWPARLDLPTIADVLARLLLIASDLPQGNDALEIVDFARLQLNGLSGEEGDRSDRFDAVVRQAYDRWGEWLVLVEPLVTRADELAATDADDLFAPDTDSVSVGGETADFTAPSENEIERLLAAASSPLSSDRYPDASPSEPVEPIGTRGPHDAPDNATPPVVPDRELREAFLEDANRCLGGMEIVALAAKNGVCDAQSARQVCRELHTLKGASASVGLRELASFLHDTEEHLQSIEQRASADSIADYVLETVDAVRGRVNESCGAGRSPAATDSQDASLPQPASPTPVSHAADSFGQDIVRIKASQLDRLLDMLAELVMLRNRRESRVAQLKRLDLELLACTSRLRRLDDDRGTAESPAARSRSIGELSNDLIEITRSLREVYEPLSRENQAVSHFTRQFRQELVELSRQPLRALFHRLQRSIHDAAQTEGKRVRCAFLGEETGLDRSLQDRLYEPLLHIVRNAVSHGVETESQRVAAGKEPLGTITLIARSSANLLVIDVRDDGAGLDYEAIRRRGMERGLLQTDHTHTPQELSALIFQAGFSTRAAAGAVAGRGVGMDVVADALQRMRGWVEVDSVAGQGTCFRLFVPLRSVIEHVMVFRAGGQLFGLPLVCVHRTGVRRDEEHAQPRSPAGPETNRPAVDFRSLFPTRCSSVRKPEHFLVLDHHGCLGEPAVPQPVEPARLAIEVDEIIGPEEVVVRPLPPLLRNQLCFSGASLSGSGEILLMLDGRRVAERLIRSSAAADETEPTRREVEYPARGPSVLVVDDSLSARRVLTQMLSRHGFQIAEACDGVDAMEQMRTNRFSIVFTDLEMPRANGFTLIESIRASDQTRHLPVVACSSLSETEFQSRAAAIGVSAFLPKPADEGSLQKILVRLAPQQHDHDCSLRDESRFGSATNTASPASRWSPSQEPMRKCP